MKIEKLKDLKNIDFHDSCLLNVDLSNLLNEITITVCEMYQGDYEHNKRKVTFSGVLRVEFEQTGIGSHDSYPIEIYEIYQCVDSPERLRWEKHLKELGVINPTVFHIVLASSYYRGWGSKDYLEGINIVCTGYKIHET